MSDCAIAAQQLDFHVVELSDIELGNSHHLTYSRTLIKATDMSIV